MADHRPDLKDLKPALQALIKFKGMAAVRTTALVTSGGSAKVVSYDTEEFDTENAFNLVTGEYTIPEDGIYQISGSIAWNAGTTGEQRVLQISANAIIYACVMVAAPGETDPSQQRVVLVSLSQNDLVFLNIVSPASDQPISIARLEVHKVGEL